MQFGVIQYVFTTAGYYVHLAMLLVDTRLLLDDLRRDWYYIRDSRRAVRCFDGIECTVQRWGLCRH